MTERFWFTLFSVFIGGACVGEFVMVWLTQAVYVYENNLIMLTGETFLSISFAVWSIRRIFIERGR